MKGMEMDGNGGSEGHNNQNRNDTWNHIESRTCADKMRESN